MEKKILIIFGTRPEAIKLVPVIEEFKKNNYKNVITCFTGQHISMVDQVLNVFNITPDINLSIMKENQDLASLTSALILKLSEILSNDDFSYCIVQGDTTTALCGGLVSFYKQVPVGHVEAGLRTYDIFSPFPEEFNRQTVSRFATHHFAPTNLAAKNLENEGIDKTKIFVTGNTVIDALLRVNEKNHKENYKVNIKGIDFELDPIVLITGHRRENIGDNFENIFSAIKENANLFPEFKFIYPLHLNPKVRNHAIKVLQNTPNIFIISPLNYRDFVSLMMQSKLILTDSGGIQEEAPTFNIPVLVFRKNTERPEGVLSGTSKIIGTNYQEIFENIRNEILEIKNKNSLNQKKILNPYGDGRASERICKLVLAHLLKS